MEPDCDAWSPGAPPCPIFGNVTDTDVRNLTRYCAQLCRTGGTVVWTRHRRAPDLVPTICRWFGEAGFDLEWLSGEDAPFGVGVHRFTREPPRLATGNRMFTFGGATPGRCEAGTRASPEAR